MASSTSFFQAIETRRSIYKITAESTIPDSRIEEIVSFAIKHCPSTFNVQSARAVILLKDEHKALWDLGDETLKTSVPPLAYEALKPKVEGYRAGYGSILFFEDEASLNELAAKNPMVTSMLTEWSDASSGMHQFTVWTALEAEGLGCNLQHYNFMPAFCTRVAQRWNIPEEWKLKSQLVFGKPIGGPENEKTFKPLLERVKLFGAE